ncbi:tRNA-splicing endonuclease subunit Sen34 [Denticeps clupeoides]|uniref:tRNA-splicing endonuclease subunit Sen34 n=1 Tax=Denticeps clupeoides TaxID=299321 RepID=A0AAY4C8H5_9TELE|nr:tRNA-splicing endonuclease subunit Sen34 [Denticeps clupeoides]
MDLTAAGGSATGRKRDADTAARVVGVDTCGSTPVVWRMADVKCCRDAGVVGSLVGSLARQPRQNSRLGRPLELLDEEVRLLAESGRAVLLLRAEGAGESEDAHSQRVKKHQEDLEQSYAEQRALALQEKKSILQRVMAEKKDEDSVREHFEALERNFSFPRSSMAVQLCTAQAGLSYHADERSFLAASWPLCQDERLETRFSVFRDLRRRGFYLTSAGKFGGDYLVYPGDPLRFHAHFIALCISMEALTPLSDVLAIARLGSNVKKTVLLCSPQESEEDVIYTSLQWSGMV